MLAALNGEIIPAEQAMVSIFDRGFLYGDGLFETIPCYGGRPFRWPQHAARLEKGAEFLRIQLSASSEKLLQLALELMRQNQMPDCLIRIAVSRGVGARGYSAKGANQPTWAITLHALPAANRSSPPKWKLITSTIRIPSHDALAGHKTSSKLPHIMARMEAEQQGADEALMLNSDGQIAEAASSNVFWIEAGVICTPPLASGALPGVTRQAIWEICDEKKLSSAERNISPAALREAEGVFLTLSSLGVVEVSSLDGHELLRSPMTGDLAQDYWKLVELECA